MNNPFDQFDASKNPFDQFDQEPQEIKSLEQIRAEVRALRGPDEANFLENMGRGMMDVYQGAKQLGLHTGKFLTDNPVVDQVLKSNPFTAATAASLKAVSDDETVQRYDRQLSQELEIYNRNNPGFSFGRLLGNIATPISLIPGGGQGVAARTGLGLVAGVAGGATQPVTDIENFGEEKLKQIAIGGTVGAAIPFTASGISKVARGIWNKTFGNGGVIHRVFTDAGRKSDVAKFLREQVPENKDKIIRAIERSIRNGDDKTIGEIIAEANVASPRENFGGMLVALQDDLRAYSDAIKSFRDIQKDNHLDIIDAIAGTEDEFLNAVKVRSDNAARLYEGGAFLESVIPDEKLTKILNNDFAKKAIRLANKNAVVNEVPQELSNTKYLHYIKEGLDEQLSATGDSALKRETLKAANKVKDDLVDWLKDNNKKYEMARLQYQIDSAPINKMKVGQELRNVFLSPLGKERRTAFANALNDAPKTIKKATGFPRYNKLEDVIDPDQASALRSILDDLTVAEKAKEMSRESHSFLSSITGKVEISLPHILERNVVIANAILKKFNIDNSEAYRKILIDLVQSPDEFLKAYSGAAGAKNKDIAINIVGKLKNYLPMQDTIESLGLNRNIGPGTFGSNTAVLGVTQGTTRASASEENE